MFRDERYGWTTVIWVDSHNRQNRTTLMDTYYKDEYHEGEWVHGLIDGINALFAKLDAERMVEAKRHKERQNSLHAPIAF
jgi:hypothetical protein